MNLPPMDEMLRRSGLNTRSRGRADCKSCEGGSKGTVGYNDSVAHCFRCGWKVGRWNLAKSLGLLPSGNTPDARRAKLELSREARTLLSLQQSSNLFLAWKNRELRAATDRYHFLGRIAERARKCLAVFPDEELAWDALARFYHEEAELVSRLDFLSMAKASNYLEFDSTAEEVFVEFKERQSAA